MSKIQEPLSISQIMNDAHKTSVSKDFWNPEPSFEKQLMNFHSEISEAWEEWRNGGSLTEIYYGDGDKPEGIPVELADEIIRICDTAKAYAMPLERAIREKLKYNITRPRRHGGKRA